MENKGIGQYLSDITVLSSDALTDEITEAFEQDSEGTCNSIFEHIESICSDHFGMLLKCLPEDRVLEFITAVLSSSDREDCDKVAMVEGMCWTSYMPQVAGIVYSSDGFAGLEKLLESGSYYVMEIAVEELLDTTEGTVFFTEWADALIARRPRRLDLLEYLLLMYRLIDKALLGRIADECVDCFDDINPDNNRLVVENCSEDALSGLGDLILGVVQDEDAYLIDVAVTTRRPYNQKALELLIGEKDPDTRISYLLAVLQQATDHGLAQEAAQHLLQLTQELDYDQTREQAEAISKLLAEKEPTKVRSQLNKLINVASEVRRADRMHRIEQEELMARAQAAQDAATERMRRQEHERLFTAWKNRIERRVVSITRVFSGVFGLDVREDAVLTGEVQGSYGSIHYGGGSSAPGMSMSMSLMVINCTRLRTFIEIEEGQQESEWSATFDSLNFLVHHELAHLADTEENNPIEAVPWPSALGASVSDAVESARKEIVVDGIAMRMASELYVHPNLGEAFYREQEDREHCAILAHAKLAERIAKKFAPGFSYDPDEVALFVRLYAQLTEHIKRIDLPDKILLRLVSVIEQITPVLTKSVGRAMGWKLLHLYFRQVYRASLTLDLQELSWRDTGDSDDYATGGLVKENLRIVQ